MSCFSDSPGRLSLRFEPIFCRVVCMLHGGTRGPALRLCHDNAVVLRLTGSDSRGRLSLRFLPLLVHCGGDCFSAGREAPPYGYVPLLMHCGRCCFSAGRKAPPYGLILFCCLAVGVASRRDARPRPTFVPRFRCDKKTYIKGGCTYGLCLLPILTYYSSA